MTSESTSIPIIKNLKENLAKLSLLFLGQHLWTMYLSFKNPPTACLCKCCTEARKAYKIATNEWPTHEQELQAMYDWSKQK